MNNKRTDFSATDAIQGDFFTEKSATYATKQHTIKRRDKQGREV